MNEKIKMDIEKTEAAIEQLKAGGEELFADQIAALEPAFPETPNEILQ